MIFVCHSHIFKEQGGLEAKTAGNDNMRDEKWYTNVFMCIQPYNYFTYVHTNVYSDNNSSWQQHINNNTSSNNPPI